MDEGYSVVLCGAPDDVKLGERIRELTNYPKPLFDSLGRTSLRELGASSKGHFFYVSADTGPLHIATAFKKDLVALYGPTRPDRTGPYGDAGAVILVSLSLAPAASIKPAVTGPAWPPLHRTLSFRNFKRK